MYRRQRMNKNILGLYSKYPCFTGHNEHYTKAKGVYIWSNGKKLLDMSYFGLGSCLLGYANPVVNKAVKKVINRGNICTLNDPNEIELAEILSQKYFNGNALCRYTRSGGEAIAMAMTIAKENTDKKGILRQGYNGWHAENMVCKKFNYNDIPSFIDNIDDSIGIVICEEIRDKIPEITCFKIIHDECKKRGIIIILDCISSGFRYENKYIRETLEPDIIVLGKAISNGYAMSAIVGKTEIMENGKNAFISSNYFTESMGTAAAIATIKELEKINIRESRYYHKYHIYLYDIGAKIMDIWQVCSDKYKIDIEINENPSLAHFNFKDEKWYKEYRTIFVHEFEKYGILANTSFYPTYAHNEKHIEKYRKICDKVFSEISKYKDYPDIHCEKNGWKIIEDRPIKIT